MAKKPNPEKDQRTPDEQLVIEAQERFKRCQDWEADFRQLFLDDLKFSEADSDNGYQWPDSIRKNRDVDARPCLTINKTRQHNLLIINDAKQNKPGVTIRASGGEASKESADVYEGLIRHIEYKSNAQDAYDCATEFQVKSGIGYWRVVSDYAGDDSFDQDLFIRRIKDPLSVYLDPDIQEVDGSDAKFGFIFSDMTCAEFERKYPSQKDTYRETVALDSSPQWLTKDHVRVAEYYKIVVAQDELINLPMPDGSNRLMKASELPAEVLAEIKDDGSIQRRPIETRRCMWYLIAGRKVIDKREWPGKYVPIVRVVGEETIVDGKLERKGHTRAMKDAQRMYNYWTSSATEHVALQSKTPYVLGASQVDGYEDQWANANRVNYAYLAYNDLGEDGQPLGLPPPTRQEPPTMSQAYMAGMQTASTELQMVSGQYDSMMGQDETEASGVAINNRQRQGDRATYHYIDGLAKGIRFTGKILVDLIPKFYDTPRVARILAKDGTDETIQVDPQAQQPLQGNAPSSQAQKDQAAIQRIFNPGVGTYEVVADTGPAYQSQREAAFNAMNDIAGKDPTFMEKAGDLFFRTAPFPMAEEIAERYARSIPPNILGDAQSPQEVQLTQQLDQANAIVTQLGIELAKAKNDTSDKDEDRKVDMYRAETDRLKALADASNADPALYALVAKALGVDMAQTPLPTYRMSPEFPQTPPTGQPAQPQAPAQPAMPPQGAM